MAQRVRDFIVKQAFFQARPKEVAVLKSSTEGQVGGKIHEFKGEVEEATGNVTDNPRLESKGTAEKINGSTQKKVGEVEKVMGK